MPTIQLIRKPHTISFSKNPILFSFRILPFSMNNIENRTRLIIQLLVESESLKGDFTPVWESDEYPDIKGIINLNIQSIIDANLTYLIPDKNTIKFHKAKHQIKRFQLKYFTTDNDALLSDTATSPIFYAVKGGLAKEEFHESLFFTDNVLTKLQPLHYCYGENLTGAELTPIRIDEIKWLFFMLNSNMQKEFYVEVKLNFTDGTNANYKTVIQPTNAKLYECFAVRIDLEGVNASAFTPVGKIIWTYEAQAIYGIPNPSPGGGPDLAYPITQKVKFLVDYRPMYNPVYLFYRNSLGGLDTQSFLGEKDFKISVEKNKSERLPISQLIGNYKLQDEFSDFINFKSDPVIGHTGFLKLEVVEKLSDLFLNKQVFDLYGNRLRPLYINTANASLHKNNDKLYNLQLEWAVAWKDESYTRKHIIEQPLTCPAVVFIEFTQEKGQKLHITWLLADGYDKIHIHIENNTTGGSIDTYLSGNSGFADITIMPPFSLSSTDEEIECKARTVCNDELAPYSFGAFTAITTIIIKPLIAPNSIDNVADESHRSAGFRILQSNATDLVLTANDIANNGGALFYNEFFDSAFASTTTSENGADLTVEPNNTVGYEPTPASLAIAAEDYFYYRCREVVPGIGGGFIGTFAKVRVPLSGQIPKVYVKATPINIIETEYRFGILKAYKADALEFDYYLSFYKDLACTMPVDVTSFGIVIAYQIEVRVRNYNSLGGLTSETITSTATQLVTCTGSSLLLFASFLKKEFNDSSFVLTIRTLFHISGSSTGNFVLLNFE